MKHHNILVIDEMLWVYNTISSILTTRSCNVDHGKTKEEGLNKVESQIYDLVILDVDLPHSNGIEICRKIKSIDIYKYRPLLMLTSDPSNLDKGLIAGASDYILKPFEEVELTARVFTQINSHHNLLFANMELIHLKERLAGETSKLFDAKKDMHMYFYQTSHSLKAPINTLNGLVNLIHNEYPKAVDNPYFPLIEESVNKMSLVNQQVSIIGELKTTQRKRCRFNLLDILHKVINTKLDLPINVQVDDEIELFTDPQVFETAIIPVIDNAIVYSQLDQFNDPIISIKSEQKDGIFMLTIRDEGTGIYASELGKIFNMFHRSTEKSNGTGLGLYISKLAFNKLGIAFNIDSNEKEFTIVNIDLTSVICIQGCIEAQMNIA